MGQAIERIALERGHQIVAVIDADNQEVFDSPEFKSADAAIEFTAPSSAPGNVVRTARLGVPVVCGSTGWADRRAEVEAAVKEADGALLAASNFSVGVYVFNEINRKLAKMMERLDQYRPGLIETHHVHKLDHPSGTALTVAHSLIEECPRIEEWVDAGVVWVNKEPAEIEQQMAEAQEKIAHAKPNQLPVLTYRDGEVPGIHVVSWMSPVDSITLEHSAQSRDGFALGAVMAAEWIAGKKGIFSINDMMNDIL